MSWWEQLGQTVEVLAFFAFLGFLVWCRKKDADDEQ
jgi:hypothetical protein